jgi:hypothetical protein
MRARTVRIPVPENDKRPGIAYAFDEDGLELPVIDISHPAFALPPGEGETASRVAATIEYLKNRSKASALAHRYLLPLLARRSVLVSAITRSSGACVSGIATYRLKLGPGNLGSGWAGGIDRRIAESLPCYCARLRLRDAAAFLAEACAESAAARPGRPLRLINVAGGAAADSLNALMMLRRAEPTALEGRRLEIIILDRDEAGPAFARRALEALMAEGMPLAGLDAVLRFEAYDWSEPGLLGELGRMVGEEGAACALSSEGGLFDYGGDEDISANLRAFAEGLRAGAAKAPGAAGGRSGAAWIGTLSRSDGPVAFLNRASGAAVRLRSRADLGTVAESAGYRLARAIDNPLSTTFRLDPIS